METEILERKFGENLDNSLEFIHPPLPISALPIDEYV
jgi:hypothetical protein